MKNSQIRKINRRARALERFFIMPFDIWCNDPLDPDTLGTLTDGEMDDLRDEYRGYVSRKNEELSSLKK